MAVDPRVIDAAAEAMASAAQLDPPRALEVLGWLDGGRRSQQQFDEQIKRALKRACELRDEHAALCGAWAEAASSLRVLCDAEGRRVHCDWCGRELPRYDGEPAAYCPRCGKKQEA